MQNKNPSKLTVFIIGGGCLLLILCGAGAVALGLVSSLGSPQPSYSVPQDSYSNPPQKNSSGGISADLVGHWRYTDILDSNIPLIIDYNIYIYADGTFEADEVNESGQRSNYSNGTWTATDSIITLIFSTGETAQTGYSFHDGVLVFENISGYYERVGP
ncbi:MAG: hypothetical protein U0V48_17605 [Anaerolineales bacterium]